MSGASTGDSTSTGAEDGSSGQDMARREDVMTSVVLTSHQGASPSLVGGGDRSLEGNASQLEGNASEFEDFLLEEVGSATDLGREFDLQAGVVITPVQGGASGQVISQDSSQQVNSHVEGGDAVATQHEGDQVEVGGASQSEVGGASQSEVDSAAAAVTSQLEARLGEDMLIHQYHVHIVGTGEDDPDVFAGSLFDDYINHHTIFDMSSVLVLVTPLTLHGPPLPPPPPSSTSPKKRRGPGRPPGSMNKR